MGSADAPVRQSVAPATDRAQAALAPVPVVPHKVADPRPPATFDAAVEHTADPCTALAEPMVPEGYEQLTTAGITVAWNPTVQTDHVSFRPLSTAHLIAGVLEEAAQLTGTDRRAHLTVIVDVSLEDFRARMRVPAGVRGFYNGGEVRLPSGPSDLRMNLSTLRHEIMHAQIHATVGCVPRWLHEGLATYFGGVPPVKEWFAMLRSGEPFDIATLHDPTVFDPVHPGAARMYGVAAAMVVYIVQEGGGEHALPVVVRAAKAVDQRGRRRIASSQLWHALYPGAGYREVLDRLAERIFGMPRGPRLEHVFRGPICCMGRSNVSALSCWTAQPLGSESTWRDETSVPGAMCRTHW